MISALGGLSLLFAGATVRRWGLGLALAIGAGLTAGSFASAGGNAIPVFYVFAALATGMLAIVRVPKVRPFPLAWLYVFGFWAVLITLLGPLMFAGAPVMSHRLTAGQAAITEPLAFNTSNVAQAAYVVLGIGAATYLMAQPRTSRVLATWAFATGVGLSFVQYVAQRARLPWPKRLFDNSENFTYTARTATGAPRFRGIFPEPSMLAVFCVAALVYFLAVAVQTRGRARLLSVAAAAMAVVDLLPSTSTTAWAAPILTGVIGLAWWLWRFLSFRAKLPPSVALAAIAVLIVAAPFAPHAIASVASGVRSKLGTVSYSSRSWADAHALHLTGDSFGLGMGLGSNRASSLVSTMLSDVGIIGVALFVLAVVAVCRRAWRCGEARPVVLALLAMLVGKAIAWPDLNSPGLEWLLLGVAAAYVARAEAPLDRGASAVVPGRAGRVAAQP